MNREDLNERQQATYDEFIAAQARGRFHPLIENGIGNAITRRAYLDGWLTKSNNPYFVNSLSYAAWLAGRDAGPLLSSHPTQTRLAPMQRTPLLEGDKAMKMQPGDYIHKDDIPDEAAHNRIREAVRAMGYTVDNGAGEWDRRNGKTHQIIALTDSGHLVWRSTGDCDGRRLTPADILDAGEQPNVRPTTHGGYGSPKSHPAADILADITAEARVNPEPWTAFEYLSPPSWVIAHGLEELLCAVAEGKQVRRKPRTIRINGHDVPEPCREPLVYFQAYFVPAPGKESGFILSSWMDDEVDHHRLRTGIVHLTPEAAKAHSDALVSFTRQED